MVTRKNALRSEKAEERAHILEGYIIALDNIDEVIKVIRSSYNDAKQKLMERFGLSDVQAQAILDMRLARLRTGKRKDRSRICGTYGKDQLVSGDFIR